MPPGSASRCPTVDLAVLVLRTRKAAAATCTRGEPWRMGVSGLARVVGGVAPPPSAIARPNQSVSRVRPDTLQEVESFRIRRVREHMLWIFLLV